LRHCAIAFCLVIASGSSRFSEKLAGLVLAGGQGTRFGGPKAWAVLPDGRTFLEACVAALRHAGAEPLVATLPPASVDPAIDGLVAVSLSAPGLDMFASIRVGLQWLIGEKGWTRVAILPVDHPLVTPVAISVISAVDATAVIPCYLGKHGHPVVLDRSVADAVADGRRPGPTLREVLRACGAVDIAVDDPGTTANCNTPEQLARHLEMIS
jgi:CTP:molybdopterin cytidylyltransferase MocA